MGSNTTCSGMKTPNSSIANIVSLPRNLHLLST